MNKSKVTSMEDSSEKLVYYGSAGRKNNITKILESIGQKDIEKKILNPFVELSEKKDKKENNITLGNDFVFIITTISRSKLNLFKLSNSNNELDVPLLDIDQTKIEQNHEYIAHASYCPNLNIIYIPLCKILEHYSPREDEKYFAFPYEDLKHIVDYICKYTPVKNDDDDDDDDNLLNYIISVFDNVYKKYHQELFQENDG